MAVMTQQNRILVVEDDEDTALLLRKRLEAAGFDDVQTVASGSTALSWAAEHQPSLVILDVGLPDLNGYQVCQELRKLYNPWFLPILMLTGRDKPVDQLRGFAHGADAYLTKPYSSPELLKTIEFLLGSELNEPAALT